MARHCELKTKGSSGMVFTAIVYKSDARKQKTAVTIVTDSFEDAQKKLLSLYGKNLVSIVFEIEKNFNQEIYESYQEKTFKR